MTQYELIKNVAKYGFKAFGLTAPNQVFLLTLLSYYNYETGECYPSNESVESGCGIRPDNLHRYKKALLASGVVSKTYFKKMGDGNKHSAYVIDVDFMINRFNELELERVSRAAIESTDEEVFGEDITATEEPVFEQESPFESSEVINEQNIISDTSDYTNMFESVSTPLNETEQSSEDSPFSANMFIGTIGEINRYVMENDRSKILSVVGMKAGEQKTININGSDVVFTCK